MSALHKGTHITMSRANDETASTARGRQDFEHRIKGHIETLKRQCDGSITLTMTRGWKTVRADRAGPEREVVDAHHFIVTAEMERLVKATRAR